jgi:MIP family channel proteins
MATAPLKQRVFVEALGTFLLVFLGAGAIITSSYFFPLGSSQLLIVALAHGIALGIAVTIAMGISGGHINPAVTIAMLVTRRIKAGEAAAYIVAQVIGALIGAVALLGFPAQAGALVGWGAPALGSGISVLQGIFIEALITFVLVIAVFGTCVDKRAPKIAGFGVGLALFTGILVAGPFTGAAANPARALGPEIATLNFTNWYVYWIGPVLGAVIAALLYEYFVLRK